MCVSSQAGCGMACPFCATGQGGLQRNLSTAEIVEQVRLAAAAARDGALGEPGAAVQRGVHGHGRAAGQLQPGARRGAPDHRARPATGSASRARSVTVSTVGLVPAIGKLADEGPAGHAGGVAARPRRRAARHAGARSTTGGRSPRCSPPPATTPTATGRRVSIEYALIRDVNDQPWRADLLGKRAARSSSGPAGARQPDPAQPDAGQRVGRLAPKPVQDEFVRRVRGGRASPARCATPAARRSPPPAASSPPPRTGRAPRPGRT